MADQRKIKVGDHVRFVCNNKEVVGVVLGFTPRVFGDSGCMVLTTEGPIDSPSILELLGKEGES